MSQIPTISTIATPPLPAAPAPERRRTRKDNKQNDGSYVGTGRRKTAVARVRIRPGSGAIKINGRDFEAYFPDVADRMNCVKALEVANVRKQVDAVVTVAGGGRMGQSAAVLMGMARALQRLNSENGPKMRENGFLTRDAREVERKKYGRRKARRRFQFSKR